jgi:PGF-pre-PGF domain-containing protein
VAVSQIEGYEYSVSLSASGQPLGVDVSFNPDNGVPPFDSTMTITVGLDVLAGTYTITILGVGADGTEHTRTFTLMVQDFTISVSPASGVVNQGGSTTTTVLVLSLDEYHENVRLSARGQPAGVKISFDPASGIPDYTSIMTIEVGTDVPLGDHVITVVGTGRGNVERTASYTLTVTLPPIHPGEEENFVVGEAEIIEITIVPLVLVENAIVDVERIERPENVPPAPPILYTYIDFRLRNIADENIERIAIKFKVEKSWLQEKNVDPLTIRLYRYHANEWRPLPTDKIGESATAFHYLAESPGFSPFAIVGQEKEEPVKPILDLRILGIVSAIIVAIVVLVMVWRKKASEEEWW